MPDGEDQTASVQALHQRSRGGQEHSIARFLPRPARDGWREILHKLGRNVLPRDRMEGKFSASSTFF